MSKRIISILLCLSLFCLTNFYSDYSVAAPNTPEAQKAPAKHVKRKKRASKKSGAAAAPLSSTMDIRTGINQIVSKYPNLNIGVLVESIDNNNVIYEYNANQNLTPASTLKLMTAAAALTYLGPNYIFQTKFLSNSNSIQNGTLNGNLYVKFSGDPELSVSDINEMIAVLSRQGIHNIAGNLIIDDFDMDRENMAPGWLANEQILCYAAPSNAVIINRNCFGFTIISGPKSGSPIQIKAEPNLANINVINQASTNSAKGACALELKVYGNNTGSNAYLLTGCLRPKKTIGVGVSLNDTRSAATTLIKYLLQQNCISVAGQTMYARAPANLHVIVNHESRPVSALITKMLKKSDNLIAGALFKKLGGTYFNTMGTWQNGAQAVRNILGPKAGINFNQVSIVDGSGLSRLNAVSPNFFGKLLRYAYHMPFNDIFYRALPNSGIDGTLRGRLGGATLGKIHAKTGTMTMNGTSGLAGYIQTVNHQNLIFAILVNNPRGGKGSQGTYHYIEDRICQFLAMHQPIDKQLPIQNPPVQSTPTPTPNPISKT